MVVSPELNYFGEALISYRAVDTGPGADGKFDGGLVQFTITDVNDPPTAQADTLPSMVEDFGVMTIPVAALLANDTPGPANESAQTVVILSVSNATGGSVTLSATNIVFSSATNFNGLAGFTYTVQDNGTTGGAPDPKTATARASFSVIRQNDPPAAVNDTINDILEDSARLIIPSAQLLANDAPGPVDETSDILTIVSVGNAVGGTVEISSERTSRSIR